MEDLKLDEFGNPIEEQTEVTTPPAVEIPKFETIEDYNKHIQSVSSKAKGELLKEIGYEKVADIKTAIAEGQSAKEIAAEFELTKKQVEDLTAELATKNEALAKVNDEKLLTANGIPAELSDTFFTLLNADKSDLTREEKAAKVKVTLLSIAGVVPKFGADKGQSKDEAKVLADKMKDLQKL